MRHDEFLFRVKGFPVNVNKELSVGEVDFPWSEREERRHDSEFFMKLGLLKFLVYLFLWYSKTKMLFHFCFFVHL